MLDSFDKSTPVGLIFSSVFRENTEPTMSGADVNDAPLSNVNALQNAESGSLYQTPAIHHSPSIRILQTDVNILSLAV